MRKLSPEYGHGLIDFPNDPGCSSADDDDEINASQVNHPPIVIPYNQVITTLSTIMSPTVTDDGLPLPPMLTYNWSLSSGPGIATFANSNNLSTNVSFSVPGEYYLALQACDGELCSTGIFQVIINLPTSPVCDINSSSLSVPSSVAYSSVGNFSVSWNVPAGCNSMIEFNSGNYGLRYVPTTSSGTYTINYTNGVAQTESSIHVSLIAGNSTSMKSITKDVVITQLPQAPAINQCEITSLTTTPVSLSGGNTTLTWSAPAGCIVYIEKWIPGLHVDHVFNPGTYYFPNTGSVIVPVTEPTTFYVAAQTGADIYTVNWVKTVDVIRQ